MGVDTEIVKQSFNLFALIIAIIFFLLITRPNIIEKLEREEKSITAFYNVIFLLTLGIYFLIDYICYEI